MVGSGGVVGVGGREGGGEGPIHCDAGRGRVVSGRIFGGIGSVRMGFDCLVLEMTVFESVWIDVNWINIWLFESDVIRKVCCLCLT